MPMRRLNVWIEQMHNKVKITRQTITAIKNTVKDKCTIKADGVSTLGDAEAALDVGASIIGCKNAADLARLVLKAAE